MFALTVLEECNAQNDNVPDEPRLKIIQVGMLSYYWPGYQAYEEFGEQIKRAAREKDTPEGRVFRPLSNSLLLLIVNYQ